MTIINTGYKGLRYKVDEVGRIHTDHVNSKDNHYKSYPEKNSNTSFFQTLLLHRFCTASNKYPLLIATNNIDHDQKFLSQIEYSLKKSQDYYNVLKQYFLMCHNHAHGWQKIIMYVQFW